MRGFEENIGTIERVDDTMIGTRFVFLHALPLLPLETFIEYTPLNAKDPVRVTIPLHLKSIVAGYVFRGGLVLGIFSLFAGFFVDNTVLGFGVCCLTWIAASLLAWRLGALSNVEKDQRRVYGAWLGPAVDPVVCGGELDPWMDRLRGLVAEHARGTEVSGYRSRASGPRHDCASALESTDVALWGAAFTLVRAEMARTKDAGELRELARIHEELWGHIATKLSKTQKVRGFKRLQAAAPVPGKPVISRPFHRTARFWGILVGSLFFTALVLGIRLAFFILKRR